ncbi:hypothetical protein DFH01_15910 [Falsiroseomonas bella]|uniref:Uncharacterized protein n=1 Tax=Falsiroseomonas bella TaxID=2184016 RepID=A0A317FDM1_9PROT|nr:hypothetical protein [Falsiroseomonas bella]PWS36623.1 hypothetical protein DFH01_15910 [Falsiroseomonas bella]
MSKPLDDFNRRMTHGDALGPATNAAESAAQPYLDAQRRSTAPTGGGSIEFGTTISGILLLVGIVLFAGGAYALETLKEGAALMGIAVLILSGGLILVGGGGLAVSCFRALGSVRGIRDLGLATIAGLLAWWFAPWFGFVALLLPHGLLALGAAALVLVVTARLR